MADRNPGGPPADDAYDRDDRRPSAKGKSDPLAELARLIGQTDPFNNLGRSAQPAPVHDQDDYDEQPALDVDERPAPGRPAWIQRAARQDVPQQDLPSAVHPLKGYAANYAASEPDYNAAPSYSDHASPSDPSRYDDAHYDEHDTDARHAQHDPAYSDDPYAYQEDYGDEVEGHSLKKRRGGMVTVAVVLLLAVVGTGGAFAYRTYIGSPRSGEPPIIKADTAPNKIVPASPDAPAKMPDRIATGEGSEKIVPREEQPVDVNQNVAPRMVFPPLSSSPAFPSAASVTPAGKPAVNPVAGSEEPRKIKTFPVRGDQSDIAGTPAPKPASRTTPRSPAANANASAPNAPMSLSPTPAAEQRRVAAANSAPAASGGAGNSSGGYVVQISSQRNEADAQASYRALQGKFPSVLGSRAPLIKRADLGDKGVYYRAMVGPFGSPDEAAQLCGSLKAAGGQCVVQKN
jgi:hypothetical protein